MDVNPQFRLLYPWEESPDSNREGHGEYEDEPTPATSGPSFAMSSTSPSLGAGYCSVEIPSSSSGEPRAKGCRRSLKYDLNQSEGEAVVLDT